MSPLPAPTDFAVQDLAVYVHWPFCAAKCPYCDFNSHVRRAPPDQARFARALAAEIAHAAAMAPGRVVTSVFLGGGTPSLMAPATVAAVLDAVAGAWSVAPDAEITLEANPTSVESDRFAGYRLAGVNRVSLGVQAMNDADLRALGRLHTAAEAMAAVEVAARHFARRSFDLIYARPGQSPEAWASELREAVARGTEHLSLYQLTIEPGTPFEALHRAGKLRTPDPDLGRALWDVTREVCEAAGLPAYEVSNHARLGAESRHNLAYWRGQDYAGVGPGAHGRLTVDGARRATSTEKAPEAWLALVEARGHGLVEDAPLSPGDAADELLLMGLRLREGIDPARYRALAGRALDERRVADLVALGLVAHDGGRLRVTAEGFPVLDAVVADLAA